MPAYEFLQVRCRPVATPDGRTAALVHVSGEIDADTTAALLAALLPVVDQYALVRCDLSEVRFCGAAGVNALAAAGRRAMARRHRLELCGVCGLTRRVLAVAGLDQLLPVSE